MKQIIPLVTALVILMSASVYADCDIDGDWTDSEYTAGEKMKFSGSITPSSGFISGYLENPVGDRVLEIPARQIDSTFEISILTNQSYLNGTYKAKITYNDYANGSSCGQSVVSSADLITTNTQENLELEIQLTQKMNQNTFSYTGTPVDTSLGRIETVIVGKGATALPSSIKLMGTKLVQGEGIGDIDIQLSMCQTNEEILTAYKQVSTFLNSSYTDVVSYEKAISSLQGDLNDTEGEVILMRGERDDARNSEKEWMRNANSKLEWWLGLLIFLPLGFVGHIMFMRYDNTSRKDSYKRPTQREMRDDTQIIKSYAPKNDLSYAPKNDLPYGRHAILRK